MYQSVRFEGERLLENHAEYLKKHNIVYNSPAYRGCDGLPIGNGDIGGMLHHTQSAVVLQVNKTDAIDFAPDGNFRAWSWEAEENNTAPVSCGKITITDSMPSFDWLYLEEYNETLSISDGTVSCESKTPFSSYQYRTYVSKPYNVIVFEVSASSKEAVKRKITLEKWGGVNLFHDYEQIKPVYDKNLFNVSVGEKDGTVYLEQQLRGTHYITVMRVLGGGCKIEVQNGRSIQVVLEKSEKQNFTVMMTVVTAHDGKASLNDAMRTLDRAEKSQDLLYQKQKETWSDFWDKSLVYLPDDDYLENIYYINLYQLGSCSLGAYPVTFAGLWNWYGDTRNWGHYYHWNHQQTYWGVHASNHGELAENYLRYRFNMLENAKADAKRLFGSDEGAFFSDISNYNGYNALEPDTVRNLTVGAQIAMDFYRHYQYTLDEDFLLKKAYPVMKSAASLYLDILEKDSDGFYRIKGGSTCYESYWNMKDTVTDFASIQTLFSALLDIADIMGQDKSETAKYAKVKEQLYPLPVTASEHGGGKLRVISPGTKWNGEKAATAEGDYPLSPFPLSELSAVYPSGYIGLSQNGTEGFETARNTARLLFDMDVYAKSKIGSSGHSVVTETAARLGMREDCIKLLRLFVERYQEFPNGFAHYADIESGQFWSKAYLPRILPANADKTDWDELFEKSRGPRAVIPSGNFLHCYFESAANIMAGVNEMLLQSYDRIIRVFPATPQNYTAAFTLSATGGFTVTSEMVCGDIRYVHVKSAFGRKCKIDIPWLDEVIRIESDESSVAFVSDNGVAEFETKKGGNYLITRSEHPFDSYYREKIPLKENTAPKEWNGRTLGQFSLTKGRGLPDKNRMTIGELPYGEQ